MIRKKTKEEIFILKEGGAKLAHIIITLSKKLSPDFPTKELDKLAFSLAKKAGGEPAFLNYKPTGAKKPFPASVCVSINEEIVHGPPGIGKEFMREGDIVTLDMGLKYKGLITDMAVTFAIGEIDKKIKKLMEDTQTALKKGIEAAIAGKYVGDIGFAVESYADRTPFSIVEGLAGHGVGFEVHEDPFVPNVGRPGKGEKLEEGMVLAIEPMLAEGSGKIILDEDGFTYKTADGKRSAHFEHTITITEEGPKIMTEL